MVFCLRVGNSKLFCGVPVANPTLVVAQLILACVHTYLPWKCKVLLLQTAKPGPFVSLVSPGFVSRRVIGVLTAVSVPAWRESWMTEAAKTGILARALLNMSQ